MARALKNRIWAALLGATLGQLSAAQPSIDSAQLSYHERPGTQVPLNLSFRDADGETRTLANIAHGRPLILIPAYYDCTSLCGLVRSSLFGALGAVATRGDYPLAVLSIDPTETSASARMAQLHDRGAIDAMHGVHPVYLTGDAPNIQAVTDAVGFRDRRDPLSGQFLHPAGVVFLTARGTVSGYLLGVGYTPAQVRSALERAQAGQLAAIGAPLLLLCFHFDPSTGQYSLEVMKVLRLAGVVAVLTLLGVGGLLFYREGT